MPRHGAAEQPGGSLGTLLGGRRDGAQQHEMSYDGNSQMPVPVMFGTATQVAPAPAPVLQAAVPPAPTPAPVLQAAAPPAPAPAGGPQQAEEDALPDGWERRPLQEPDASGRAFYFVDHNTQTTHWELPAPVYAPPEASKRDLYDIHVPEGCGPGSEIIACGFHVQVPPATYAGSTFRVEFRPTEVVVPPGAYAGVKTTIWVDGLKGRVTIPAGFGPGQRFTIMAPSSRTEDNQHIHVASNWAMKYTEDGRPYYVNHDTKQTQWDPPPGFVLPPQARPTSAHSTSPSARDAESRAYFHIAPDRSRHAYSAQHNLEIAAAKARGDQSVRLSDVVLPNQTRLQFEIRFGPYGGRMAERTGIMQMNIGAGTQREVEEDIVAAANEFQPASPVAHVPAPALVSDPVPPPAVAPAAAGAILDKEEAMLDQSAQLQAEMLSITDEAEIEKLKKRNMILGEVVKTEESYCASLEKIAKFYYEPMKEHSAPGCSEADFKAIFGSFGSLLTFQRGLLKELRMEYSRLSSADTKHFSAAPTAMVLKKWAPYLKFYRPYVRDYHGALECIKRLAGPKGDRQHVDSAFRVWLQAAADECGSDLEFFLIQPIQRIPRYVLLLSELIKYTPDQLPEKQILHEVHTMVQEQCNWINENAQLDDSRAKCGVLHQQFRMKDLMEEKKFGDQRALESIEGLAGFPETGLMQPHRWLVLQENATDLISHKPVCVLAFNDNVILAELKTEFFSKRQYLRFVDKLNLKEGVPRVTTPSEKVIDVVGKTTYQYNQLTVDIRWKLEFANQHQRDEFVKAVKEPS